MLRSHSPKWIFIKAQDTLFQKKKGERRKIVFGWAEVTFNIINIATPNLTIEWHLYFLKKNCVFKKKKKRFPPRTDVGGKYWMQWILQNIFLLCSFVFWIMHLFQHQGIRPWFWLQVIHILFFYTLKISFKYWTHSRAKSFLHTLM